MGRRSKGEGTLYRRGSDGRWVASLYVGPKGDRERKEFYGTTKTEARLWLKEKLRLQDLDVRLDRAVKPFEHYLDEWLEEQRTRVRASTYLSQEGRIRLHVRPIIGKIAVGDLDYDDIKRVLAKSSSLSAKTRRHLLVDMRSGLNYAMRMKAVADNVAKLVKLDAPSSSTAVNPTRALSFEEVHRFLEASSVDRLGALYALAIYYGLRSAELRGLRWISVDFERKSISVNEQIARTMGSRHGGPSRSRWIFVEPKAGSGRTLPLLPVVEEALVRHRAAQEDERRAAGVNWEDYGLVFSDAHGKPLWGDSLLSQYRAHLSRAGVPQDHTLHDLRHTTALLLKSLNVDINLIKEILGHSQIALTANLYGRARVETLRPSLAALSASLDGGYGSVAAGCPCGCHRNEECLKA